LNTIKSHKDRLHLFDGVFYMTENFEKMVPTYQPTQNDTKFVRSKSTGIIKIEFQMILKETKINFTLSDVGGQRSER
jgi:uncharacterized protein YjaG (DUF416 family)